MASDLQKKSNFCPDCGAELIHVNACKEYFDQMISWDFSDFTHAGKNHHLVVLCYYLQHPAHFSKEGLKEALSILKETIENHLTDKDLYQLESKTFSSTNRDWSVTANSTSHGSYFHEIDWSMTAADVVTKGLNNYPENVRRYAEAIYQDLLKYGKLDTVQK